MTVSATPRTIETGILAAPENLSHLLANQPSDPYTLPKERSGYARHARFATMSRLLTCLVNEHLVTALCVTATNTEFLILTSGEDECGDWSTDSLVFQLRHRPILAPMDSRSAWSNVFRVSMIDPEDLGLGAWRTEKLDLTQGIWGGLELSNPIDLMRMVGRWRQLDKEAVDEICSELLSSMNHQEHAYVLQETQTVLDIQTATAIDWEQSLTEGHATHPMHRARHALPPLSPLKIDTEFRHIQLRFVAVSKDMMAVEGKYTELIMPMLESATPITKSDSPDIGQKLLLETVDLQTEVVIPVHPLHMPAIQKLFPFARVLDFVAEAEAQASLRTVSPRALASSGLDIKLPLGIKTSSALRTVSTYSAYLGPRLTKILPAMLANNQDSPLVSEEPASVILRDTNPDIAKYLACIIRRNPQSMCSNRDVAVVAAALTERLSNGRSIVCTSLPGMDTQEARVNFLRVYVQKLFRAFLPPIITHGFTFEAHQQNTLVCISKHTSMPTRFVIRDFGGIMVYMEMFTKANSGVAIPMLPNNSTTAKSMEDVYGVAYHTLIQCQVHRLVRALNLHYSGIGWRIVREELAVVVPSTEPLWQAWMEKEVLLKSFVTMKLGGLYRNYVYSKVPNILLYEGEQLGVK
ncbi:hypothetical protein LPJ73_001741 [Coemansia sp. RSA 2703]|nr:hypothetical protein LPJ73_001741 [Coemansia sp. RSA 2703]KAJ2366053.1 hypothetical protein IW150_006046 [Coemansia sp. RSA 2607]KAJ2386687.1 hypothetical protein GGI05_004308 [Coemansia sp. RSA 2603]